MKTMNVGTKAAQYVLAKLNQSGYQGYLVGGCVRDAIMGRKCNDMDITTNALPEVTKSIFSEHNVIETGVAHGTVTVMVDDEAIEITTYRTEGAYSDKRHPDEVEFVDDLAEDLKRRDFTMNAIAIDVNGSMADPYGGMNDIEAGVIRAVGCASDRFQEDALRIMRAVRFAGQTGFEIEHDTEVAMLECRDLLNEIAVERIFDELKKLIVSPYAGNAIAKYIDVLGVVIPELKLLDGFEQCNPSHKYDVLHHCIYCMQNLRTTESNHVYMKFAGLFHDIGKPETFALNDKGVGHCYGHPEAGAVKAGEILRRLKADNFTMKRVVLLTRYHDLLFRKDHKLLKNWLRKFGPEVLLEILEIKRADNLALGCNVDNLIGMFDEIKLMIYKILENEECFSLQALKVDGGDIMRECNVSGSKIGIILDELLSEVIDERIDNKKAPLLEEAMRIAKRLESEHN